MIRRIARSCAAALLGVGLAGTGAAQAPWRYQYAAKIVCGAPDTLLASLVAQRYATAVNVHNPSDSLPVVFFKKLAFTYPPGRERPGRVTKIVVDTLKPDQALVATCGEFATAAGPSFEGFVVLLSPLSLDVTAVYTVRGGIDVVQVRERVR